MEYFFVVLEVLQDFFPKLSRDPTTRPLLLSIIEKVSAENRELPGDRLDFPGFLILMKQVQNMRVEEQARQEEIAIRTTRFSAQEVNDFREFFLNYANGNGGENHMLHKKTIAEASCRVTRHSLEDVKALLRSIIPLGDKLASELGVRFEKATHGTQLADFAQFLILMRDLIDTNFANIKERLGMDST